MDEAKGVVKHILLVNFKEEFTYEKVEELVKSFSKQVSAIESLKGFHWGKHSSIHDQYEKFDYVFELTFGSMEGLADYMVHPDHVAFANVFFTFVDKLAIIDYKPITLMP